jgi:hypothetical protein
VDPDRAAHIAALQAKCDADAAWRAAPCVCGRRPYTRDQHRFLTGNYACRNPTLRVHRHFQRTCEACGETRYRPEMSNECTLVGIG